jgi:hypothetical protein
VRARSQEIGKRDDLRRASSRQFGQPCRNARLSQFQKGCVDVRVGLSGLRTHGSGKGADFVVGCRAAAAVGNDKQTGHDQFSCKTD